MAAGTALGNLARAAWLDRLKQRALDTVNTLGHKRVFISCSALKKAYRDQLRSLADDHVEVIFMDLQVDQEELVRRMKQREGHYMKDGMVEGQLAIWERPCIMETDVIPVDAGMPLEQVSEEVLELLGTFDCP